MRQAGAFGFRLSGCYAPRKQAGSESVKRVNLVEYFDLSEALYVAKKGTELESSKGINVYVSVWSLTAKLKAFVADDNGFSACKHVANSLADAIQNWIAKNVMEDANPVAFDTAKFEKDYYKWQYGEIATKIDAFRSVFEAECRDVDVYSVGQVSIYKTSALVSAGAGLLPTEMHSKVGIEVLEEFNNAGRCLAFSLPTACGFHALRGLELVMDSYLRSFGVTKKMNSWNDYIVEAKKLVEATGKGRKPSAKVTTMLDRMRELDRNPLMHPRNTLDDMSANTLFQLAGITVVEMVKDMAQQEAVAADIALIESAPAE